MVAGGGTPAGEAGGEAAGDVGSPAVTAQHPSGTIRDMTTSTAQMSPPSHSVSTLPRSRSLAAALLGATCAGCGTAGSALCERCSSRLHEAPPGGITAAVTYRGVGRDAVTALKYRNQRHLAKVLAAELARRLVGRQRSQRTRRSPPAGPSSRRRGHVGTDVGRSAPPARLRPGGTDRQSARSRAGPAVPPAAAPHARRTADRRGAGRAPGRAGVRRPAVRAGRGGCSSSTTS